jgi:hypothetical protein
MKRRTRAARTYLNSDYAFAQTSASDASPQFAATETIERETVERPQATPEGNETFETARIISATGNISGTVGDGDSADYYRLDATSNGKVSLRLPGNMAPTLYSIYDANRNLITQVQPPFATDSYLPFNVASGQTYYVVVTSVTGANVNYGIYPTFTPTDNNETVATATPLPVSATYNSGLYDTVGDVDVADYYSFVAGKSGEYRALLTENSGLSSLVLLDSNHNVIARGNSTATTELIAANIEAGKTYYIGVVAGDGQGYVNYSLRTGLLNDDTNSFATATRLDMGAQITTTIGDVVVDPADYYVFTATSSGIVSMAVSVSAATQATLKFEALNSQQEVLATANFNYSSIVMPGTGSFEVTAGQTYYIRTTASTANNGVSYTFSYIQTTEVVADNNEYFDTATRLLPSTLLRDRYVGRGDFRDVYTFTANRSGVVSLDITEADGDVNVSVYDSNNALVAQTRGNFSDDEINFIGTMGQKYYVIVDAVGATNARYDIEVKRIGFTYLTNTETTDIPAQQTNGGRPVLYAGSVFTGSLNNATDEDWFELDLPENGRFLIRVEGTENGAGTLSDPDITLRTNSGYVIAGQVLGNPGQNALAGVIGTSGGPIYLQVHSATGAIGTYRIVVIADPGSADTTTSTNANTTTTTPITTEQPETSSDVEKVSALITGALSATSRNNAINASLPLTLTGTVTSSLSSGLAVYKLTTTQAGTYTININAQGTSNLNNTAVGIFDSNGINLSSGNAIPITTTSSRNTITLAAGANQTYYFAVSTSIITATTFSIASTYAAAQDDNDIVANLTTQTWPFNVTGSVGGTDVQDVYRFTTNEVGTVRFNLSGTTNFQIYTDAALSKFGTGTPLNSTASSNVVEFQGEPGQIYYLRVAASVGVQVNYTATSTFTPRAADNNNTFETAQNYDRYDSNVTRTDYVGVNDVADIYKISPTRNGRITLGSMTGTQATTFTLLDANRNVVSTYTSGQAARSITLDVRAGGTYYLKIESSSAVQSNYSFTNSFTGTDNNETFESATTLTTRATPTLNSVGTYDYIDYYKVVATQSGTMRVLLAGYSGKLYDGTPTPRDMDVRVYSADRTLIASSTTTDVSEYLTTQVVSGQTYYVEVTTKANSISFYHLTTTFLTDNNNTIETAEKLSFDTTVAATLGNYAADPEDFYALTATATGVVRLQLETPFTLQDEFVTKGYTYKVLDAQQRVVAMGNTTTTYQDLAIGVQAGQIYYIQLSPIGQMSTATYNLTARYFQDPVIDNNDVIENATALFGSIRIADQFVGGSDPRDVYAITPVMTGALTVQVADVTGEVDLVIYNSRKQVVMQSHVTGSNGTYYGETVMFMATAGEQYYAVVEGVGIGHTMYSINVGNPSPTVKIKETTDVPNTADQLLAGMTFSGTLGTATDIDIFTASTPAGTRSVIRVEGVPTETGTTPDLGVRIRYGSGGTVKTITANSGEAIEFSVGNAGTGTPTIEVFSASGATGAYKISYVGFDASTDFSDLPDIPGQRSATAIISDSLFKLDVGSPLISNLDTTTDTDWIRVAVTNSALRIALTPSTAANGATPSMTFNVRDMFGNVVSQATASGAGATLDLRTSGTYWIEVLSQTGGTGKYTLSANVAPAADSADARNADPAPPAPPDISSIAASVDPALLTALTYAASGIYDPTLFAAAQSDIYQSIRAQNGVVPTLLGMS